MRLSDIFEAYLDKFYRDLGEFITHPEFTMEHLASYLAQHGIYLELVQDPSQVGSASIVDIQDNIEYMEYLGKKIPKEIYQLLEFGYKKMLTLYVEAGITLSSTLGDLPDLNDTIASIQHELQHAHQPKNRVLDLTYSAPGSGRLFDEQDIDYLVQAHERPAQAVNLANSLASVYITPEEFEKDMELVANVVLNNKRLSTLKDPVRSAKKHIRKLVDELKEDDYDLVNSQWFIKVVAVYALTLVQLKYLNKTGLDVELYKQIFTQRIRSIKALIKVLKTTYKKVVGYQQRYH